MFQTTPINKT